MQFPGSRDGLMPFHFSHSFQEGKHSLMPFQFRCCLLKPLYLQHVVSLWWSTLNTEIKDLLLRIQSYQRLFLQCRSSSEYSFMCFTYCQKFSFSHFCFTSSFRFISTESSLKNACPWSEKVDWYHCFFKCSNSESDQTCDFMNRVWVVLELHMLPVISKHKASWKKFWNKNDC